MECSNCGSPSARIYERIVGGAKKKACLCENCYEKLYSKSDVSDLFPQIFGGGKAKTKRRAVCPSCGMTREQFQTTRLLGCAGCYSAFRDEIYDVVRHCQWDYLHKGKEPNVVTEDRYDLVRDLVREQEYIKGELDRAEDDGDDELAEQLQRRLKAVREKLMRAGEG